MENEIRERLPLHDIQDQQRQMLVELSSHDDLIMPLAMSTTNHSNFHREIPLLFNDVSEKV
jgi:hypothetical protein